MTIKVVVGSTNPIKIAAVRSAFTRVWPEQTWDIQGLKVPSGIPDQPTHDEETIRGARNRARRALEEGNAAYGVGLEGGLQRVDGYWFESGWVVIVDGKGGEGIGSSIRLPLPECMVRMIEQGMELGEVVDEIFQQRNSGQTAGFFGLMTEGAITRETAYADGVVSALGCFVQAELFGNTRL